MSMSNIYIFTCANQVAQNNFKKTIKDGIDLSDILPLIADVNLQDRLRVKCTDGRCYLWGAQEKQGANRRTWEKMSEDDLVLGYREKSICSAGFIIEKTDDSMLAEKIWGKYDEGPFRLIYFLSKPIICSVSVTALSEYLGKEYRGFAQLNPEKTTQLLNDYTSFNNFINERLLVTPPPPSEGASNMLNNVIKFIENRGFHFAPWQIACYVTALRTKPFVILAGVSGTGKSKLPALVAEATGGKSRLIPVRPDWTDSAEVIGYKNLQDRFQAGHLLQYIAEAQQHEFTQHVCIIDEMNLARVEHYFAEVLSRIEDRKKAETGTGYKSEPLFTGELNEQDHHWGSYGITPNLAIVGTVNMDESTHGFSKKVLDRAFTMELSDVDLDMRPAVTTAILSEPWSLEQLVPCAISLGELHGNLKDKENALVELVIRTLKEINAILAQAQLQVGYRTRDEIALFVIHAQESLEFFKTVNGDKVDPLDLALLMKILPRISGGSSPIRATVLGLLGCAYNGQRFEAEQEAESLLEDWKSKGQSGALFGAKYPRTAARLCLMLERLRNDGFTSFWL
jgi:hypothetical protein